MSGKHINYMTRTFDDFKSQLIEFTKQYYPELTDTFNDASVGKWLMEMYAAVGDDLSYHLDRVYQNTNIDATSSRNAIMSIARSLGLKIPGRKAGLCEVQFTCILPVLVKNGSAEPNWNYAPLIKRGTKVAAGKYVFELSEDVNFAEQFNKDGYSDRKYTPITGSNGNIVSYTVSKSGIVHNAETHIYRKVLNSGDIEPFMEIFLPDKNICGVDSIIFKASSSYQGAPDNDEFFHNEEQYRIPKDTCYTMRFFEVNSLSEQYVFNTDSPTSGRGGEVYEDYIDGDTGYTIARIRKGSWKGVRQKFITEYTDNGYLKIIFGPGTQYDDSDSFDTDSKTLVNGIINNDMMGVLPKEGWTMFVMYSTCDGLTANLGEGAINTITNLISTLPAAATDKKNKSDVVNSISVTNLTTILGGKDIPTVDELRYLIKYNAGAIGRGVVINDYKCLINTMPARFGCPYKTAVKEENNKIKISLLNAHADGTLSPDIPSLLADNIVRFLEMYKMLGDYIAIQSGKVYNIGVGCSLYIGKNYNAATVIGNVINTIKDFMHVSKHEMGEDIFVGDIEREIMSVDGVLGIIDLDIYNLYDGVYSSDVCPLTRETVGEVCGTAKSITFTNSANGAKSFKIDLSATDNILFADDDSMFEIKYPDKDIIIRAIQK